MIQLIVAAFYYDPEKGISDINVRCKRCCGRGTIECDCEVCDEGLHDCPQCGGVTKFVELQPNETVLYVEDMTTCIAVIDRKRPLGKRIGYRNAEEAFRALAVLKEMPEANVVAMFAEAA
jgi:hypothetical protein